jgi:hypothetical protein
MAKSGSDERGKLKRAADLTIVSGGQTGADRAALDFAIENGIKHRGWCPAGRKAEDGRLAKRYRLKATRSSDPKVRTRRNVRDSDATVIFSLRKRLIGGTRLTQEFARKYKKPLLKIFGSDTNAAGSVQAFIQKHDVRVLNVAGPRESGQPGIYAFARRVLQKLTNSFGARPD